MHLIVFVHGMWGRAADFNYISERISTDHNYIDITEKDSIPYLTEKESAKGVLYRSSFNEGYFTYDGVDVCGTRVANEIQEVISDLSKHGITVSELSLVGFSMGALMSRYAVGLLESRGVFDTIKPRNLVVTCGPHVGVNILGQSLATRLFNFIGQYSMARTSRQAFLTDNETNPLFLKLTQPGSIYAVAAKKFQRRVLYANTANDRRCEFYTSGASLTNPFANKDLRLMKGKFVPGYDNVVIDGSIAPSFGGESAGGSTGSPAGEPANESAGRSAGDGGNGGSHSGLWSIVSKVGSKVYRVLKRVLNISFQVFKLGVVLPVWFVCFLLNASFQHTVSKRRIRGVQLDAADSTSHESAPLNALEQSVDKQYENFHAAVEPDVEPDLQSSGMPLSPVMGQIISQFNQLGFERFYLRILNTHMAHSASIMKFVKPSWAEGKPAVEHLISVVTS